GEDAERGSHTVMTKAAKLRAEDGVVAGNGGREVDVDVLPGHGVLLDPHRWHAEAVDHVLRMQTKIDLAAGRKDELAGNEVVGAVRVGWVKANGIAFAGSDEFRLCGSKGGVDAGVAEVPGKLHAGDFDL